MFCSASNLIPLHSHPSWFSALGSESSKREWYVQHTKEAQQIEKRSYRLPNYAFSHGVTQIEEQCGRGSSHSRPLLSPNFYITLSFSPSLSWISQHFPIFPLSSVNIPFVFFPHFSCSIFLRYQLRINSMPLWHFLVKALCRPLTPVLAESKMKKLKNYYLHLRHPPTSSERKWIFPLAVGSIVSLFLLFLATLSSPDGTPLLPIYRSVTASYSVFVESKLHPIPVSPLPPPPRFAYLISGSVGDGKSLKRTLLALYHPHNSYVVHLDLESPPDERDDLQNFVKDHPIFQKFGNVRVIKKANLVTYRGPTMVANTLHAAAILLREGGAWDWFINLSASDYPLVTQDG